MDGKWWHGVMGHGTMGHSHNIDGKQILFPAGFERQFVAAAAATDGLGTNLVKIISNNIADNCVGPSLGVPSRHTPTHFQKS